MNSAVGDSVLASQPSPIASSSLSHWIQLAVVALVPLFAALAFGAIFVPAAHPIVDTDVYEAQADLMLDGRLVEPLGLEEREQPFFTAVLDEGMVYKYEPGTAAVAAVGRATADRYWLGFALFYALLGPVVWALTRELTGSEAIAVVAALVVGLSPVSLMQGAFTLSYIPALVLSLFASLGVLRLNRTTGWTWPVVTGVTLAVIPWFRIYEPPIIIGAFTIYVLAMEGRRVLPRLASTAVITAVGLLPLLATNLAATGSVAPPFLRHFTDDRLGFGNRRATLEGPFVYYGPADAFGSVVDGWVYLSKWVIGGPLLLLAGIAALAIMPRRLAALLGGLMVAVTLANALFWGTFNAVRLGAYDMVGPFYQLPVLVPLGIGAGYSLLWLYQRRQAAPAVAIVVVGVALGIYLIRPGLQRLDRDQQRIESQSDQIAVLEEPALVILDSESMLLPFRKLRNTSNDPAVLYQLGRADLASLPLLTENADREAYQLVSKLVFDPPGHLVGVPTIEPLVAGADVSQRYEASCGGSGEPTTIRLSLEGSSPSPDRLIAPCPGATLALNVEGDRVRLFVDDEVAAEGDIPPDAGQLALVVELLDDESQILLTERRIIERSVDDGRILLPGRPVVDNLLPLRGYLILRPLTA